MALPANACPWLLSYKCLPQFSPPLLPGLGLLSETMCQDHPSGQSSPSPRCLTQVHSGLVLQEEGASPTDGLPDLILTTEGR